ncbi:unnamed protein product, partial [Closterium sp. Naga37s-1]
MPAAEYVAIDDHEPTYAEPGEDPLATEPTVDMAIEVWAVPTTMQGVYDDSAPTPHRRGRVLPAWITQASRCQPLLDAGVTAVMRHSGYA